MKVHTKPQKSTKVPIVPNWTVGIGLGLSMYMILGAIHHHLPIPSITFYDLEIRSGLAIAKKLQIIGNTLVEFSAS